MSNVKKMKLTIMLATSVMVILLLVMFIRSLSHFDAIGYVLSQKSPGAGRSITIRSSEGAIIIYGEFVEIQQPPGYGYIFSLYDHPERPGWRIISRYESPSSSPWLNKSMYIPEFIGGGPPATDYSGKTKIIIEGKNSFHISIPYFWPILLLIVVLYYCRRSYSGAKRAAKDSSVCPVCGYDLRATLDRCPECGTRHAKDEDVPN